MRKCYLCNSGDFDTIYTRSLINLVEVPMCDDCWIRFQKADIPGWIDIRIEYVVAWLEFEWLKRNGSSTPADVVGMVERTRDLLQKQTFEILDMIRQQKMENIDEPIREI